MSAKKQKSVAVLMGGWSVERPVSLISGMTIVAALQGEGYDVKPIDVERNLSALIDALTPAPDVVFNALHGKGGEDGCVQGVLEMLGIPYTHSGVLASAVAMDKPMAKKVLQEVGVPSPEGMILDGGAFDRIEIPFAPPYVIKPADEGSSIGVHIIRVGDNRPVIEDWLKNTRLLVERYIPGRDLTVGVRGFADQEAMALGVTEIRPRQGFFDYEAKYTEGCAEHILPAPIPDIVAEEAKRLAVLAHETLGCSGISRSDFRWDEAKEGVTGLYFLEINTQPGFTPISLLPEQAAHQGVSFGALVSWLVEGAQCHA